MKLKIGGWDGQGAELGTTALSSVSLAVFGSEEFTKSNVKVDFGFDESETPIAPLSLDSLLGARGSGEWEGSELAGEVDLRLDEEVELEASVVLGVLLGGCGTEADVSSASGEVDVVEAEG